MNCFFNNAKCQFLYGPFNGLRGLFKFDLLSSDSFYCQGALKTSFRREITKRFALRTIAEAIIRAKLQKFGCFTAIFSKRLYIRACSYLYGQVGHTANWWNQSNEQTVPPLALTFSKHYHQDFYLEVSVPGSVVQGGLLVHTLHVQSEC